MPLIAVLVLTYSLSLSLFLQFKFCVNYLNDKIIDNQVDDKYLVTTFC